MANKEFNDSVEDSTVDSTDLTENATTDAADATNATDAVDTAAEHANFEYVVDFTDDADSDNAIEEATVTVDSDGEESETVVDEASAADAEHSTAGSGESENADDEAEAHSSIPVPDVVHVANSLDASLRKDEHRDKAPDVASASIFRAYPMLSLHDVTLADRKTKEHIWHDLTLSFEAGECYAVVLDSTDQRRHAALLALMGGFIAPTSGQVMTKTTPYTDLDAEQLRGHRLGMITPQFSLRADLNALGNLLYVMNASGQTFLRPTKDIAKDLLDAVHFGENTEADEKTLAGKLDPVDEARLKIARAIAIDPDYVIVDDLTVNLNDEDSEQILGLLQDQVSTQNKQRSIIVVTTNDDVAAHFNNVIDLR